MCPDCTKLQKNLLHLACRHHIFELLAQTAFATIMGSTAGPEVLLFKRFQTQWKIIDKKLFNAVENNKNFANVSIDKSIIAWAENTLKERKNLRDDYIEFIDLSLIFVKREEFTFWLLDQCIMPDGCQK